jgi:hypothetical protein
MRDSFPDNAPGQRCAGQEHQVDAFRVGISHVDVLKSLKPFSLVKPAGDEHVGTRQNVANHEACFVIVNGGIPRRERWLIAVTESSQLAQSSSV